MRIDEIKAGQPFYHISVRKSGSTYSAINGHSTETVCTIDRKTALGVKGGFIQAHDGGWIEPCDAFANVEEAAREIERRLIAPDERK